MFKNKSEAPKRASGSSLNSTPGPSFQAAKQTYFERGSQKSVENGHWKGIAALLAVALCFSGIAFWQLIPLKTVEVVAVAKTDGGRLVANLSSSDFKPDQEMTAYFLNEWAAALVEISSSTWRKNVEKANRMASGIAKDQIRDYLNLEENSPAAIVVANNVFVRSYEVVSINFIKNDVALIRFRTISRKREGEKPAVRAFAITANFGQVKPTTRAEALENPAGLYVTSFNLTEEAILK